MGLSLTIAKIFGIRIRVHITFLLVIPLALTLYFSGAVELGDILFVLPAAFGLVVLHELAHSLAARYFGIKVRDITLLPIGGVARLEDVPRNPKVELLISLAGPGLNVALAAAILPVLLASTAGSMVVGLPGGAAVVLLKLLAINVFMAAFNFLPAFPMDGGRILRALLAQKLHYVRATETAALVGKFAAGFMAIAGIAFRYLPLVAIAGFVLLTGIQEVRMVRLQEMQRSLGGAKVYYNPAKRQWIVESDSQDEETREALERLFASLREPRTWE